MNTLFGLACLSTLSVNGNSILRRFFKNSLSVRCDVCVDVCVAAKLITERCTNAQSTERKKGGGAGPKGE